MPARRALDTAIVPGVAVPAHRVYLAPAQQR